MLVYVVVQRSFTRIALHGRLLSCVAFLELLDKYFAVSFLFFVRFHLLSIYFCDSSKISANLHCKLSDGGQLEQIPVK